MTKPNSHIIKEFSIKEEVFVVCPLGQHLTRGPYRIMGVAFYDLVETWYILNNCEVVPAIMLVSAAEYLNRVCN